jgi:hypothetical protein
LNGLTFFLRIADRCGGEREQRDASRHGNHSSRAKTVQARCSIAAHEHSVWFAGEDENGTEVPMTLSLCTVGDVRDHVSRRWWKWIAAELGVRVGSWYRVTLDGSKIRGKIF